MARPKKPLTLSDDERSKLALMARRPKTSQRQALRARIVLECASGLSNEDVAAKLDVHKVTVGKWRERFRVARFEGLLDEPRPGVPRKITDEVVERIITKTLESKPKGQTHWSTRTMARAVGISQGSIGRIWRAFGLQPHRSETFKLSPDPLFIEKVRDIVGLYMNPPTNAVVLCIDEKSQMQALDRTQPLLPMRPGQVERRTHDYVRHGTTSLFAALNVATGHVIGEMRRRHTSRDFLHFLKRIDASVSSNLDIHVVLDNLATHKTPMIKRWLLARPRFHLHFTPTYASWLNQVERLFAELQQRALARAAFRSVDALEDAAIAYLDARNEQPKPFVWTADADLILGRVARNSQRTSYS